MSSLLRLASRDDVDRPAGAGGEGNWIVTDAPLSPAEIAWRRFTAHALGCVRCHTAGGQSAPMEHLCREGMALMKAWDRIERGRAAGRT